jgi:polyisoprenoid-binding protein YceI
MEAGDRFIGIALYLCISQCRSDHPFHDEVGQLELMQAKPTVGMLFNDRGIPRRPMAGRSFGITFLGVAHLTFRRLAPNHDIEFPQEEHVNTKVLTGMRSAPTTLLLAASLWLCVPRAASAQQVQVTLDPTQSKVEWTLDATMHTVHGTFKLKSASVSFDSKTGNASGEIVVDATSAESGNQGRDNKMHKDVLESKRYPEITFLPKHIMGTLPDQGSSTLQMKGVLHIHGADHEITWPIQVQRSGDSVKSSTSLIVPYEAWGMKNPSNMFLKVSDKVDISIAGVGKLTNAAAGAPNH